jgi:hypothetical protein
MAFIEAQVLLEDSEVSLGLAYSDASHKETQGVIQSAWRSVVVLLISYIISCSDWHAFNGQFQTMKISVLSLSSVNLMKTAPMMYLLTLHTGKGFDLLATARVTHPNPKTATPWTLRRRMAIKIKTSGTSTATS